MCEFRVKIGFVQVLTSLRIFFMKKSATNSSSSAYVRDRNYLTTVWYISELEIKFAIVRLGFE